MRGGAYSAQQPIKRAKGVVSFGRVLEHGGVSEQLHTQLCQLVSQHCLRFFGRAEAAAGADLIGPRFVRLHGGSVVFLPAQVANGLRQLVFEPSGKNEKPHHFD